MTSTLAGSVVVGERLSNREAADYLGLKAATLNKWRCHGDGPPFIKVGRLIRYRRADLDAYLRARLRLSTSDPGVDGGRPLIAADNDGATIPVLRSTQHHTNR